MSELDLLCQAIQTQDTVESGDVKFLYMDENTIYRFQNNKMKPISKTLMNKAKRYIQQQQQQKPAKAKKVKQQPKRKIIEAEEEEEENEETEEVEQVEQPKKPKLTKPKQPKKEVVMNEFQNPYNISLDEYYNNKNRMEFMTRELERMSNKITKLKQYKTLINKLTGGGEIDDLPTQQQQQQQQQQIQNVSYRQQNTVNDSLFI